MHGRHIYCLLGLYFLIAACHDDYTEKLSGGYEYYYESSRTRSIANYAQDRPNEVYPDVVDYVYDRNFILVKQRPDTEAYKGIMQSDFVSRYDRYQRYMANPGSYDKNHSSYKEQEVIDDSGLYRILKAQGLDSALSGKDFEAGMQFVDSVLATDRIYQKTFANEFCYWIADHKTRRLLGPLTQDEYLKMKLELLVPAELKLQDEE
jgi:hypothetical protein